MHWTAVVVEKDSGPQCGLASTLREEHHHTGQPIIPDPGKLESYPALELASWIESDSSLRRSLGCAAINALLPRHPESWIDRNAEQAILSRGKDSNVVMVGHFPFTSALQEQISNFQVLELNPTAGDQPASKASELLPDADLVAITGMAFVNHTLSELLQLCKPEAYVLLLGPSTPLTPLFAEYGVDLLAGSSVEDIPAVLAALSQGAIFRQVHKAGMRLITQPTSRS